MSGGGRKKNENRTHFTFRRAMAAAERCVLALTVFAVVLGTFMQ
jgi:hypothetical protein